MPGFIIEERTLVSRNLKLASLHKVNTLKAIQKSMQACQCMHMKALCITK